MVELGRRPIKTTSEVIKLAKSHLKDLMQDCMQSAQGADLLIYSTLGSFTTPTVAQYFNIPAIATHLQPPNSLQPLLIPPFTTKKLYGSLIESSLAKIVESIIWRSLSPQINQWRNSLGFGKSSKPHSITGLQPSGMPTMFGFSSLVVPKPPDWPDNVHVTGYWFLPMEENWKPPKELIEFIDSGPPPVFISFGSMTSSDPKQLTSLIVEATQEAKVRCVLGSGWAKLGCDNLPDNIYMVDDLPYEWLLPKMSAIVHHGGAGTTAAGLRAGIPSVTIPCLADQFFWGKTLIALGASTDSIKRTKLSSENLAVALKKVGSNNEISDRAKYLSQRLEKENGPNNALSVIQKLFNNELSI
jgi:UDP:flavonoid glycosyltransferase YjiC (YdhE family)